MTKPSPPPKSQWIKEWCFERLAEMAASLDTGGGGYSIGVDGLTRNRSVSPCNDDDVFTDPGYPQKDTAMSQKRIRRYGTSVNVMSDAVTSDSACVVGRDNRVAFIMRRLSEDAREGGGELSGRQRKEKYHRSVVRSQSTTSYVMTKKLRERRRLGSTGWDPGVGTGASGRDTGMGGSSSDPEKVTAASPRSVSVDTGLCDFINHKVTALTALQTTHLMCTPFGYYIIY